MGIIVAGYFVPQRFSNAATVAQVDCSTDPAIFSTGYVAATKKIGADGSSDERWTAAGGFNGFNYVNAHPSLAPTASASPSLPPGNAGYAAAYLGKMSGSWVDSPFSNAQWIAPSLPQAGTGQNQATGWGDFYFRYDFDLSPVVDPASFRLSMDWYADNTVRGVWVNSTLKTSNTVLPYTGWGFRAGDQLSTTLSGFVPGRNTILVQVGSASSAIGFLAQVKSTSLCPTLQVGKTVDGRVDASDQFVVEAKDDAGATTASVTTTGTQPSSTSPRAFVTPGKTYTITDSMAAGSASPASLYRGGLVCTGAKTGSLPVSGAHPTWTVTIPTIDDYSCTVTNTSHTYSLAKTASSTVAHPGEKVTYTVTVTNTGNSAFTAQDPASFTDDLSALLDDASYNGDASNGATVSGSTLAWSGPLAVGGTAVITYSVTVKDPVSGDGRMPNTAVGGSNCYLSCSSSVESDVQSYSVSKKASAATVGLGDRVTYTVTVQNTGSVDYTAADPVSLTDDLSQVLDDATYNDDATNGARVTGSTLSWSGALAAGKSISIVYSVTVNTPATGDRSLANAVVPTSPGGECTATEGCRTVTKASDPSLALTKQVDASAAHSPAKPGDVLTYIFSGTNSGNETLTGVTVKDPLPGLSALTYTWPGAAGTLAPGETVTATARYTLTQKDIDAGHVTNAATSSGVPPSGTTVTSPQATTDTPLVNTPQLQLEKLADTSALSTPAAVGDMITYTFRGSNTGTVTLDGVSIADRLTGLSALTYTWPGTPGQLAPGETVTATATYRVTQKDIDAGHVANSATATGAPPTGSPVATPPAETDSLLVASPALVLAKTVDTGTTGAPAHVGDTVAYRFEVTNSGNVTVTGVAVTDRMAGLSALVYSWPGTPGQLAPGESVTATATYVLTGADVSAGHVANTATATGTPPTGSALETPPAAVDTPLSREVLPAVAG
ncbi:MAG: hypothetical protein AAGC66_08065 [Leifsonia sp.]